MKKYLECHVLTFAGAELHRGMPLAKIIEATSPRPDIHGRFRSTFVEN
jgi:hypothetical protein